MLLIFAFWCNRSLKVFHLVKWKLYTYGVTAPLLSLLFDLVSVNNFWNSVCSSQTTDELYSNICVILSHSM